MVATGPGCPTKAQANLWEAWGSAGGGLKTRHPRDTGIPRPQSRGGTCTSHTCSSTCTWPRPTPRVGPWWSDSAMFLGCVDFTARYLRMNETDAGADKRTGEHRVDSRTDAHSPTGGDGGGLGNAGGLKR